MYRSAMILDDSPLVREHVRRELEGGGFVVHAASSFIEANRIYYHDKPDVILIDVKLGPLITGDKVAAIYKARANSRYSPVIILYSDSDDAVLQELVKSCECDGYIRKGPELLADLVTLLQRIESARATPA